MFVLVSIVSGGGKKLIVPKVATTTFGLNTFEYLAISNWNFLPNEIRTVQWSEYFRTNV